MSQMARGIACIIACTSFRTQYRHHEHQIHSDRSLLPLGSRSSVYSRRHLPTLQSTHPTLPQSPVASLLCQTLSGMTGECSRG